MNEFDRAALMAGAAHLAGRGEPVGIRSVRVVLDQRPGFGELSLYRGFAGLTDVDLSVGGDGTLTFRVPQTSDDGGESRVDSNDVHHRPAEWRAFKARLAHAWPTWTLAEGVR